MSELLLNASETRPARPAAPAGRRSTALRSVMIGGACAVLLAGFGVAASSVMADLVVPTPKLTRGPAMGQGLASSWPDLKDGQPAKAGITVKTADAKTDAAPAAPGPRMASLADPMAFATGTPTKPTALPPAPKAAASKPVPPTERIPVATEVAPVVTPPTAKIVMPTRTVAAIPPRPSETVRAREDVSARQAEGAKPREETPRTREAAADKPAPSHPAATPTPAKAQKATVAAKPPASPEPTKVAAKPAAAEPAKVAAVKPTPTPTPTVKPVAAKTPVTHTAAAETDSDETEILGVKIPSLAPAGQKLKDGVSALGDAVRSAF
ncbi:hypothetical protein [Methylobacterium sp. J-076]|uniref:hypothetical protein n=1 Tax=Methylobacterium sp. J-076 TaxID=2836655 RepID=UPI001FBBDE80|nr:hypothetical protein [Methylobacterium sp. J-076]MCJ2015339.1 hypothetical protein [Methylobacterium sp. J-076]